MTDPHPGKAGASRPIVNPVIRGTAPDPSIVRVGEEFYLATSTFDLMPGIRLHRSTDLVTWESIGGAIERPAQYRRDGEPGGIMLFAATLRHVDGVFYLTCTNVADDQGNFVVRASDPRGPWSDALWLDREAFDPSLLYDEGRWLYTRRSMRPRPDGTLGPIEQADLDMSTGELGAFRPLTPGHGGFASNDIEGPHLYRIGDWYYLLAAEGGTWKGHMQTCARSRSPWGPFEPAPHNPVLTHRHRVGHPVQSTGHADLVDDPAGNWWAVFLGTRHTGNGGFALHHNLGRETFLAPVAWVDGWPVIGDSGTVELEQEHEAPLPSAVGTAAEPRRWQDEGWLTVGPSAPGIRSESGAVVLPRGHPVGQASPGLLLLAQTEDEEVFEACLDAHGLEGAGVAVYADGDHFFALVLDVARDGDVTAVLHRRVDDLETVERRALGAPTAQVRLRVHATAARYRFDVTFDDAPAVTVGEGSARLLSAEAAEWFTGVHFGLVAEGAGADVVFLGPVRRGRRPVPIDAS